MLTMAVNDGMVYQRIVVSFITKRQLQSRLATGELKFLTSLMHFYGLSYEYKVDFYKSHVCGAVVNIS